jgi:hypothetical protein
MVDEDDFEDSAKLSPEELAAELRAKGADPDRLRASIDALLAEAGVQPAAPAAPAPPAKVVSLAAARESRTRRLWPLLVAAALVLFVLGGGVATVAYLQREPPPPGPVPLPTAPPLPPEEIAANALRKEAFDLCGRKAFGPCLDKLDEAAKLDPRGDKSQAVQDVRGVANAGLYPDAGTDAGLGFVKLPWAPHPRP